MSFGHNPKKEKRRERRIMKKHLIFFCLIFLMLWSGVAKAGDTGTYRILDYQVSLTPRSDGIVEIDYYQKWEVTGGHIPWITVGLPNDNFNIVSYNHAAEEVKAANESGWSGMRLELGKDYQPGEIFEVSVKIQQNNLFYADEENYKMDFTPGWYDRAFTDRLIVSIKFFAKIETVKTESVPSRLEDEKMVWEKNGLGKGERFSVSVAFPKKLFPAELSKDNLKKDGASGKVVVVIVVVFIIVIVAVLLVLSSSGGYGGGGYSGGGVYYGGSGGSGSRSGGVSGSGGFGGRSSSCACACVSCACACACAGGGGAGCDRKLKHNCQKGGQRC